MAVSRWHHYMDTHSALLVLFVENPLVSGGAGNHRSPVDSHHKIPVIRIFYFSLLLWNKRLKKQSSGSWFENLNVHVTPLWVYMKGRRGYVSVHWHQNKYQFCKVFHTMDANFNSGDPESHRQFCHPLLWPACQPLDHDPIVKNRLTLTRWTVSYTSHNSESILDSNDPPLDCLHMALVYIYHFLWRRQENMFPCTDNRVNQIPILSQLSHEMDMDARY